jgi:hypothetical protein
MTTHTIALPPRRFLCWLIDLANPGNSEEVGTGSVVTARDADQAASWYADEYDWSYGTEVHAKPLRIGTVEQLANGETGTPRLVEVQLQTDPHHAWFAVVGEQVERDAFAVSWQLIQPALWGQMGETKTMRAVRQPGIGYHRPEQPVNYVPVVCDLGPDNTNASAPAQAKEG